MSSASGKPTASGEDQSSAGRRVAVNSSLRAAAEILGKLASLALFVYIARELGKDALGDFVFALAVVQIVWSFAGFGLDRMAVRDLARDPSELHRLFYPMQVVKVGAGLVGIAAATLGVRILGYPDDVQALVAVLGLSLVVQLATATSQAIFWAYERMDYYFYSALPNKLIAAALGIAVVVLGGGLVGVAAANLAAAVVSLVIATGLVHARFSRPRAHAQGLVALVRRSFPFGLQEIFGQIVFRVDIIMLSLLTTGAIVGAYGAAYRLLEATLFVAWSVGISVLPMYSYLTKDDSPNLDRVFEGSIKLVLAAMLPVAVALLVCAEPIVDLLFGLPAFAEAVPVLRWLALAIVLYSVGHLAGILVLVRRPGRLTIYATAFVAVFNIALNAVLIPSMQAQGAAIATVASELLLAAIALVMARPVVKMPRARRTLLAPGVAAVAMTAVMAPLADHLFVALPLGAIVYLASLAALESGRNGDLGVVRGILRRRLA